MNLQPHFLRFAMAGTAGFFVDASVLYLAAGMMGWYGARLLSFVAAATTTWWLNRNITFHILTRDPHVQRFGMAGEYLLYLGSMGGGATINYLLYVTTVYWLTQPWAPLLGVALGSVGGLLANYAAARHLVFRKYADGTRPPEN